jgi:hypothetical protein
LSTRVFPRRATRKYGDPPLNTSCPTLRISSLS